MKSTADKYAGFFWLLTLADVTGILFNLDWIHYIAKPLLMPALLLLLLTGSTSSKGRGLLIAGLIFSCMGDVFLLFEPYNSLFFIAGLASFLLTHVFYITFFLQYKSADISLLKQQPLLPVVVVIYCSVLFLFLLPYLGPLKIPVLVYAIVIGSMLLSSLHIYLKVKSPTNQYYIIGALMFVLSDSVLAINKFYAPVFVGGVIIMLTYCAAQYLIVKGFLKSN